MATHANADARTPREARINVRASARQEQLLKAAAAATDKTMTDFILDNAVVEAEKVLADRRFFVLSDEQWDEMDRILSAPLRDTPKLAALLAKPSLFGTELA